jgi:hypothetical protein
LERELGYLSSFPPLVKGGLGGGGQRAISHGAFKELEMVQASSSKLDQRISEVTR